MKQQILSELNTIAKEAIKHEETKALGGVLLGFIAAAHLNAEANLLDEIIEFNKIQLMNIQSRLN